MDLQKSDSFQSPGISMLIREHEYQNVVSERVLNRLVLIMVGFSVYFLVLCVQEVLFFVWRYQLLNNLIWIVFHYCVSDAILFSTLAYYVNVK